MPTPDAEVLVRRMTLADVDEFYAVFDAVARESGFLAWTSAPPLEDVRQFVAYQQGGRSAQSVARVGGRLVGWCDVLPRPQQAFEHCGVLGMGILRAFRRRGIGRRLIEFTLAEARTYGISRVELEVFAANRPAIRLYERAGFEHEGRKRGAARLGNAVDDILCMARLFDDVAPGGRARD